MKNTVDSRPLNIEEAAAFLDVTPSHLYKLTSQGRIPHYKPGGKRLYFLPEDLLGYVRSGKVPTSDEINLEATKYVTQ